VAELTIIVPDGRTCNRCPYKHKTWKETGYNQGMDEVSCNIFKSPIHDDEKCDECFLRTCLNNKDR
jgi:hypothetical protein